MDVFEIGQIAYRNNCTDHHRAVFISQRASDGKGIDLQHQLIDNLLTGLNIYVKGIVAYGKLGTREADTSPFQNRCGNCTCKGRRIVDRGDIDADGTALVVCTHAVGQGKSKRFCSPAGL